VDNTYDLVLGGFDIDVRETEDPAIMHVILSEGGNVVYEEDIPINIEGEDLLLEDIMNYAAQAAIDLFEASRGTLGEGAQMLAKSKKACCWFTSVEYEEWFSQLRGTPYAEQALILLEELLELQVPKSYDKELDDLHTRKREVESELDQLNFERMKTSKGNEKIIIIQASKPRIGFNNYDWVEGFLDKFVNHRLEPQVIMLIQELMEVDELIHNAYANQDDKWEREEEIRNAMADLTLQKTKNEVEERLPQTGIEIAPEMAADVAELMEGVSFEEPLEPLIALNKDDEDQFEYEREVEELGQMHNGLDPAEIPQDELLTFGPGNSVKLKNDIVVPLWGGIKKTVEKGTAGWIDSLFDGHGDKYYVRTEDGSLFVVGRKDLKKG